MASTLRTALDGLSQRQRVTADNIANIDTPGFRAATVDFESSLQAALADGSLASGDTVGATTGLTTTPVGPNGNNVDLQTETMTAMRSVFQYQLMTRAVDDRYSLVETAIGGM
ncbi:MAG: flagellar basal body rod protein FlgB [Actinomycetota bacterium]|nr:flagellar basal body rod protein FlgB [Actinomycetota bacterium]